VSAVIPPCLCRRPAFANLRRGKHVRHPDGLVRGEPATTAPLFRSKKRKKSLSFIHASNKTGDQEKKNVLTRFSRFS